MFFVCALYKLCTANACALRPASFSQGRRLSCHVLDAAAHIAFPPESEQLQADPLDVAHAEQWLLPAWHCGTKQVPDTKLLIFLYGGFSIKINSNKFH